VRPYKRQLGVFAERCARMLRASRSTSRGWVVDLIENTVSAQTCLMACLVRHRRTTARMNTTVLRIFTTVIKNRQMSRQRLGRVLAARAVEQNHIAAD